MADSNVIDWEQMDMIADGYTPDFVDILREFVAEMPGLLSDLASQRTAGDLEKAGRIAHQIKGSAANFGFTATSQAAAAIEHAAKAGSWGDFDADFEKARSSWETALVELRDKRNVNL